MLIVMLISILLSYCIIITCWCRTGNVLKLPVVGLKLHIQVILGSVCINLPKMSLLLIYLRFCKCWLSTQLEFEMSPCAVI